MPPIIKYNFIDYISPDLLLSLEKLFKLTQIQKPWDAEKMMLAIANSTIAITCFEDKELVGFARVNSDGIYRAMIWDLLIHCDYCILQQMMIAIASHPMVKNVERSYIINEDNYLSPEQLSQIGSVNSTTTMVFEYGAENKIYLQSGGTSTIL